MARNLTPDLQNSQKYVEDLVTLMTSNTDDADTKINQCFGGVQEIASRLQTSTKKGIIGVTESLSVRSWIFGTNQLDERNTGGKSLTHSLLNSITDLILIIVVIGAIVSVILGVYYPEICQGKPIENSEKLAWMEGVAILGTVLVIILLSTFSDYLRDSSRHILKNQVENERKATVIRGGVRQEICYRDIKVGDLCEVKAGSIIPADGILVEITEVITDESSINRERRNIKSKKDPFVFTSTHVVVGHGKMIVLAVGERTQAGSLARKRRAERTYQEVQGTSQTLQGKLTRASAILGILGIAVGLIVTLVLLISFFVKVYSIDNLSYDPSHWNDFIKAIIIGLVIIIVAEPEGLSMAATITVVRSLGFMQQKKIFIRNAEILETMGNVTTMCCNKTGVLTTVSSLPMREEVTESYINGEHFRGDASDYKSNISEDMVDELANGIAINTSYTSNIQFSDLDGTITAVGDITECALLEFADDLDVSYRHIRRVNPEEAFFKIFPFDPDKKFMTTVVKVDKENYKIYSKGAPEVILNRCTNIVTAEGEEELSSDRRKRVEQIVEAMETKSQLKVICLASRTREETRTDDNLWTSEEVNSKLTLVAVIGIESTVGQMSAGNRMVVSEGRLITKNSFGGEDLSRQLWDYKRTVNYELIEDFTRGVAVNTNYLSDIQNEGPDRLPQQVGNPQDCALLQFVLELGKTYQHYRDQHPYEKHVVYKSFANDPPNQQYTATVIKIINLNIYRVYVKGGIDYILSRSTQILQNHPEGAISLDDGNKHNIKKAVEEVEKRDAVPVAFAVKDIQIKDNSTPDWNNKEGILSNLTFVGYLGLKETTRGEVTNAILDCQKAGLNVVMLTGSSLQSAGDFAKKTGILQPTKNWPSTENSVFGCDIQAFNKEAVDDSGEIDQSKFDKLWPDQLRVLASCPPAKKQAFVEGIQKSCTRENGEVVAVVASAMHDGPFLKVADVGLSMGVSGSNVAQEAADIVLKTDKFSGVLEVIKWGRHIYETVLKFLQFQFTVTWVTLIIMVVGAIVFQKSLLSAAQLLWLNLIMDALASLALSGDQPSRNILRHKPYGRDKPLVSKAVLRNVIGHSIYQIAVVFIIIFLFADYTDTRDGYTAKTICKPSQHATMVFTTLVFMQLFNEINCRRVEDRNVFLFDWVFLLVVIVCFAIQIIIVCFFTNAFRVDAMDEEQWLWCLFFGFTELLWGQIIFTIPKSIIPENILCCTKGVPAKRKGCFMCVRGVRNRDEVDAPTEFYGIGNQPHTRHSENSVGPEMA